MKCNQCETEKPASDFYARRRICKECARANQRNYQRSHRAERSAYNRDYQKTHRKEIAETRRKNGTGYDPGYFQDYYQINRAKRLSNTKEWRLKHPWRHRANLLAARARRQGKLSLITPEGLQARVEYYGWRCYYCGLTLTLETLHTDHRIPVSRNGPHCHANIVPVCKKCNGHKYVKTELEYAKRIGVALSSDS